MLDLNKLEAEWQKATRDKADLFDFYHKNWDTVLAALRDSQDTPCTCDECDCFGNGSCKYPGDPEDI